jgi:hypothetical protein
MGKADNETFAWLQRRLITASRHNRDRIATYLLLQVGCVQDRLPPAANLAPQRPSGIGLKL